MCKQSLFYTKVLLSIFLFLFLFTCYHSVVFYFGLIEKGLALLIIPNYLLFHTLQYFKDVQCHFWYPILLLSPFIIFCPHVFKIPYHLFAHISLTPWAFTWKPCPTSPLHEPNLFVQLLQGFSHTNLSSVTCMYGIGLHTSHMARICTRYLLSNCRLISSNRDAFELLYFFLFECTQWSTMEWDMMLGILVEGATV